MLFWLKPSRQIRSPVYSLKQRALRRKILVKYGILYILVVAFFAALIIAPILLRNHLDFYCSICSSI